MAEGSNVRVFNIWVALSRRALFRIVADGLGVVFDAGGDDRYRARNLGFANAKVDYHPKEKAGGNFAFLIDYGGDDDFGGTFENNTETNHGWRGGFFISRPAPPARDRD